MHIDLTKENEDKIRCLSIKLNLSSSQIVNELIETVDGFGKTTVIKFKNKEPVRKHKFIELDKE